MSNKKTKQRYFVLHLEDRDFKPSPNVKYEIQILDSKGRAKVSGYVVENQNELEVDGKIIPMAVIEAAKRQPKGKGDYVNEFGESIPPW
jgi:hypothetical protein